MTINRKTVYKLALRKQSYDNGHNLSRHKHCLAARMTLALNVYKMSEASVRMNCAVWPVSVQNLFGYFNLLDIPSLSLYEVRNFTRTLTVKDKITKKHRRTEQDLNSWQQSSKDSGSHCGCMQDVSKILGQTSRNELPTQKKNHTYMSANNFWGSTQRYVNFSPLECVCRDTYDTSVFRSHGKSRGASPLQFFCACRIICIRPDIFEIVAQTMIWHVHLWFD